MEKISFPTELWIGEDALSSLQSIQNKRVFIVTDPFIVQSGMIESLTMYLSETPFEVFCEIVPDPPIDDVMKAIQAYDQFDGEVIITMGGGSAIDAAKAVKFFAKKTLNRETKQFIAIPTTSGTGSEVTNFSVITLPDSGMKIPLVSTEIQPDIAILDTSLVMSVPPKITADTGMDVLTHALESYVSVRATAVSDALCEKAVRLVFENLEQAYKNGNDVQARKNMHLASCLAGMAFNITSLGLNHAIAHAAGARLHVPHGRMNAILLPEVILYNSDLDSKEPTLAARKYSDLAAMLDFTKSSPKSGVNRLVRKVRQLRQRLDMPENLTEYGLSKSESLEMLDKICKGSMVDKCLETNPKLPSNNDVEILFKKII